MLVLNDISKQFGGVRAVSNVSFEVAAGEVRGLIGPNGAGKTTLINLISGLLTPTSGTMSLEGDILDGAGAAARTRKGIARTFQNLRIFENLSVGQNIEVAQITARSEGHEDSAAIAEAFERFDLAGRLRMPANALSYGHLRRLEIVRALALNPKVLMLDEPAAGMNEQETEELAGALDWVKTRFGCATLVIDHDLKFIMTLCDRITVLNMGAVIAEGTPREITTNQDVIDAYLGEDHSNAA
ncbi:ABC transporter ATP-binding protein [Roseibium sp. MMSF_3412]|uniref:ABC transporter ATP-binding protein n=1 Tax=Roseibium sp. MMSF_3412 TaxID=3046712 RepID=UPI00273D64D9|nr:ABC transporter ATP-binding protein [Roseibium sp. MMSF_3412]